MDWETNPRISLTLTKVIDGEGVLEFEFDESGGRAEIRGEAKIKVTVTLRLVFGVDETTGEFYVETDGSEPEIQLTDIELDGTFTGEESSASSGSRSRTAPSRLTA